MEEKKEKQQNYQTWIDLSLRKLKKFMRDPVLYSPTGWELTAHLSSLSYHPAEQSSLQLI